MHGDVQVARRRPPQPCLALTGQPDALPVLHAGRYPDVYRAGAGSRPGAFALGAGVLDDRAGAPAVGARFGEPERALVAVDHARSVARAAHLRAGARACTAAMTVGARCGAGEPQRHRYALGGLEEVELGLGLEVVAATRTTRPRLRTRPTEQSAEQVPDVRAAGLAGGVEQIVEVELGAVAAGAEAAEIGSS